MRVVLLLVVLTACRRPLAPGETRCTSMPVGSMYMTKCRTGAQPPPEPTYVPYVPPAQPAFAPPAPVERKTIEGSHTIFCAVAVTDHNKGVCFTDRDECTKYRADANANPSIPAKLDECSVRPAAACFNYTIVLTEARNVMCAPSIEACDAQLASLRSSPDYRVTADQCGIYRTKNAE